MFALQPELKIFSGSANRDLAERICKYVGVPLGQATISSFPDGETYVKIEENIRGHDVFIIQPLVPPVQEHLMELLLMLDAARGALSGGQVLDDLEKLYSGKKGLSNEQQLGLGVVRLLSKGPQDQGALQALNKTLEQIDWQRNQKIICATQNALAAAGKDVKVLAECARVVSLTPEAGAAAPAAAASAPAAAASEAAAAKPKDPKKP